MTYVGAGMICSHLVNLSLLLGAIMSWGIMWPLIRECKGAWFRATLPMSSMRILNSYKVQIARIIRLMTSREMKYSLESIPLWVDCVGHMVFSVISIIVISLTFPNLKCFISLLSPSFLR